MSDVRERAGLGRDVGADHGDVIRAIEPAVKDNVDLLMPLDKTWQPSDYLPDLEAGDWREQVEHFRTTAETISDDLLVVLVGDMVTEEALPSYSMSLNGLVRDEEGTSPAPWSQWLRGWTAEENRHGDLLNAYLRLTGRVNMRAVERTVHPSSPTASTRRPMAIPTASSSTPRSRSVPRGFRTATPGGSQPGKATGTSAGSAG